MCVCVCVCVCVCNSIDKQNTFVKKANYHFSDFFFHECKL